MQSDKSERCFADCFRVLSRINTNLYSRYQLATFLDNSDEHTNPIGPENHHWERNPQHIGEIFLAPFSQLVWPDSLLSPLLFIVPFHSYPGPALRAHAGTLAGVRAGPCCAPVPHFMLPASAAERRGRKFGPFCGHKVISGFLGGRKLRRCELSHEMIHQGAAPILKGERSQISEQPLQQQQQQVRQVRSWIKDLMTRPPQFRRVFCHFIINLARARVIPDLKAILRSGSWVISHPIWFVR